MEPDRPRPRFSVVVPVHDALPYLREALDSVLAQTVDDWELVAVDDASTDGSGAVLDEYAARDARFTAVHLDENAGPSHARNVALDRARGDYVVFLDADDWVHAEMLELLESAIGSREPDVVMFDFVRVREGGRRQHNPHRELLRQPLPPTFTLGEHPELLRNIWLTANRAYRRQFLDGLGLRFHPGMYEDVPFSYSALVSASRIAVLGRVLYYYRQTRHKGLTRSAGHHHFSIFSQYRHLFAFLDRHGLHQWRAPVFDRMTLHLVKVLKNPKRIQATDRSRFLDEAVALYRELLPPDFPGGGDETKEAHRLLSEGSLERLEKLEKVEAHHTRQRARQKAREERRQKRQATIARARRAVYRFVFLRFPVDGRLAVFAAYWFSRYDCNPAAIHQALMRLGGGRFRAVWVVDREHLDAWPPGVPRVVEGTLRAWWVLARAKFLVNNVGIPLTIVKRPGTVYVQTEHGTPLKTMGLDHKGKDERYRRRLRQRLARVDYFVSPNQHTSDTWRRVYPGTYELLEYGYPRNDWLFSPDRDDVRQRVRHELGIPVGDTAVLYAPTHREYLPGFRQALDLEMADADLAEGISLLVRLHYFYGGSDMTGLDRTGRVIDVTADPDVTRLCLASDVLVTDYSSLMFDYANLGRPIVVHAPDWDTYIERRGVTFDLMAMPPGPVARTDDELVEILNSRSYESEESKALLAEFQARFCAWDDGHASERVVRKVFLNEDVRGPAAG